MYIGRTYRICGTNGRCMPQYDVWEVRGICGWHVGRMNRRRQVVLLEACVICGRYGIYEKCKVSWGLLRMAGLEQSAYHPCMDINGC